MNVWIVVAAFNEESMIGDVINRVRTRYSQVVVVDDASRDQTGMVAKRAGATVLTHLINRGQGAALKTGIDYALSQSADAIVTFDADGQHRVEDIARLLTPIEAGTHHVVLGSRFLAEGSNIPPLRKFILRLGIVFTWLMSGIKVTDTHNGLRAMSSEAAKQIRIVQDRMAHASEILDEIMRHHLRFVEVPVTITYTAYSKEKGQNNLALFKIALKFIIHKLRQ